MSDLPTDGVAEAAPDDEFDLGEVDELEPEGSEAGEEPDEGAQPETEAQPQPARQTRRGEVHRLRERLERQERELAEIRQQRTQPQQPYIDPMAQQRAEAERWQRWSEMAPTDAMREMYGFARGEMQQALAIQQFQTNDRIDKQSYDTQARASKLHQHYRADVERMLADERARGNFVVSREDILLRLVGQDTVARAQQAAPRQRQRAQQRIQQQTTAPGSPRGDVAGGRRQPTDDDAAARQRLNDAGLGWLT